MQLLAINDETAICETIFTETSSVEIDWYSSRYLGITDVSYRPFQPQ